MEAGEIFSPYKMFTGLFVPNSLAELKEISASAKLIYGRLAQYAGKTDYCYPQQETLTEELGMSLATVRRALKELEENGFIKIKKPTGKDRLQHRNCQYYFLWHDCLNQRLRTSQNDTSAHYENDTSNINRIISNKENHLVNREVVSKETTSDKSQTRGINRRKSAIIKDSLKHISERTVASKKKEVAVSETAQSIYRYWTDAVGLHAPRENTVTHKKGLQAIDNLLKGTQFNKTEYADEYKNRKFTQKEITKAIDRFSLAANSTDHFPSLDAKKRLQKLPISHFIYNFFAAGSNGIGKSHFLHYFENEPKTTRTPVMPLKEEHTKLTAAIKRKYVEIVLGGVRTEFSVKDENHFKIAARRLVEFVKKNRDRFLSGSLNFREDMAEYMIESITTTLNGTGINKVTPAWLSSNTQFNLRLPAFLHDRSVMHTQHGVSRSSGYIDFSRPIDEWLPGCMKEEGDDE